MDGHRRDSRRSGTKAHQIDLQILDEGDRLRRNQPTSPALQIRVRHHPSHSVDLRKRPLNLVDLSRGERTYCSTPCFVSLHHSAGHGHPAVRAIGSTPGRDAELDGTVKSFVERVGVLGDSMEDSVISMVASSRANA